jgi:hypothetical protein
MPFARPLKVGGIKLNMAKCIVFPEAAEPLNVTVNKFDAELGELLGFNVVVNCFQEVWEPGIVTVEDA